MGSMKRDLIQTYFLNHVDFFNNVTSEWSFSDFVGNLTILVTRNAKELVLGKAPLLDGPEGAQKLHSLPIGMDTWRGFPRGSAS